MRLHINTLLIFLTGLCIVGSAQEHSEKPKTLIGTAFSSILFDGIHVIDIRASTQAWVDSLGMKHKVGTAGPVQIYDDPRILSMAVDENRFELGVLSATHFLQLEHSEKLDPLYVPGNGNQILQSLLLLVRKDSGYNSIAALKGKEIFFPVNRYASLAQYWIDSLLMEKKQAPNRESFFSVVHHGQKTSCVVLPVFFRKCDACVVSRRTFDIMCELNPQINNELMPIEISPPYLASLICIRKKSSPELRRKLNLVVSTLHESVDGAQVLMSFHVDKYEPYQEGHLDNTQALMERYHELKENYEH